VAGTGSRIGGRALDLLVVGVLAGLVLAFFGSSDRPWAGLLLVALTLWAYETVTVACFGATLGLHVVGLRVVSLDAVGKPSWATAARRAAVDAGLAIAILIGWVVWLVSVAGDPLGRGIPDRNAATMVVPQRTRLPIATSDLPGYADGARRPRVGPLGRIGDADVRVRARLRRFDRRPVLALLVAALVLAAPLIDITLLRFTLATLAWLVVFTVDEARLLARFGGTAGHRIAGLVVLDRRTGLPPGMARSVTRALALGVQLYAPPGWLLLLFVSLPMMRWAESGRGFHDVLAGTVVVADPGLDPEAQRQRAMAVRLGRAG
jgi:uncharacterized RDD family membrane protein YckC